MRRLEHYREALTGALHGVSEFLFGAALSFIMPPYVIRRRDELERLFILNITTDLLGIPVIPSPHHLRLLPFVVPQIMLWRRRLALWDDSLETADLKHLGH